ncbi:MAG: hypothetical protein ABII79_00980 [bacterium]|jgi:hypothetical protein
MSEHVYYIIVAAILAGLIPLVPRMICLRIRVLRWLRWTGIADWHQRNFKPLVIIVRVIMLTIAVVMLVLGITGG